jgi:osmotically inducible lipoprotein OsmB
MTRHTIVATTLTLAVALGGCAGMSDTEQRVGTGAAIGGLAVGALTGEWGWAAAGAAAGAAGGYLVDQQKRNQQAAQQRAYEQGVQTGKQQAQQQQPR